jgi:DNA-binding LytR/AlgR family response regulator
MTTLRTIIIDDEPLAIALLTKYVKQTSFLTLTAAYGSAVEALETELLREADLIFLDIQMPELNGLEFAKMAHLKARIVFTTAFSEYALEGYRVNALDYLLKPISYAHFLEAAQRALELFKVKAAPEGAVATEEAMYVKSEYKLVRIVYKEIVYIEGMKDYLKIYLEGKEKPVITLMRIKEVLQKLPEDLFLRVHRSYILQRKHIEVIERNRIYIGRKIIPIGEAYKEEVQQKLGL